MDCKDRSSSQVLYHSIATFLLIGIITTGILFVFTLVLNQNHAVMAQQQGLNGTSFQIGNMTFSHGLVPVNGIQMHYVIGGHGDPVVLLHGWPQTWYEWRRVMPALARNYTVIAPDLRGLGESSKPITGYDGKTTAEDIHQLVTKLGFNDIFLVGHDFGVQVAYSYAAAHPNETKRLVILDVPVAGIGPGGNITGLWWAQFHNVHDIPEMLVTGHEREYLTWFYRYSCNPAAITEEDIDEYVSHYSSPGGMRAGFEYYRALSEDIKQNKEYSIVKLPMPVLVLGGECSFGDAALDSMRVLATDVRGSIIPNTGHWIPEEQPKFLADQLFKFFAANSTKTK
jgi:pimeloyl-ACP methyl ester carboxylesterase